VPKEGKVCISVRHRRNRLETGRTSVFVTAGHQRMRRRNVELAKKVKKGAEKADMKRRDDGWKLDGGVARGQESALVGGSDALAGGEGKAK